MDAVMESRPNHEIRRLVNGVVITGAIVGIGCYALALLGSLFYGLFEHEAFLSQLWGISWLCVGYIAVLVLWTNVGDFLTEYPKPQTVVMIPRLMFKLQASIKGYLGPFALVQCVAAAMLVFCFLGQGAVGRLLQTPEGNIRVMYDGRVLHAGQSTWSLRNRRASELIALDVDSRLEMAARISTPHGDVRFVSKATLQLQDGNALEGLVRGKASELQADEVHGSMRERFFARAVNNALSPYAAQVVAEVQEGKLPGTRADMLLRYGQLIEQNSRSLPGWMGHVRISDVNVDSWDLN